MTGPGSCDPDFREEIRRIIIETMAERRGCQPNEISRTTSIADNLVDDSLGLLGLFVTLDQVAGVRVGPMDEFNLFYWREVRGGMPVEEVEKRLSQLFADLDLSVPDFAVVKSPNELLTVDVLTLLVVRNMKDDEQTAKLRRAEYDRFQKRWGPFATVVRDLMGIAEMFSQIWSGFSRCWRRERGGQPESVSYSETVRSEHHHRGE